MSQVPSVGTVETDDQTFFRLLYKYYKYLFPYELLFKWLSYPSEFQNENLIFQKSESYMKRREISFEVNINDTIIYQRYQSFGKPHELQQALIRSNNNQYQESFIQKIDIGAVFDKKPSKTEKCTPQDKEFVIDIDMTDYDKSRNCCQDAKICLKCWNFMKVACELLYQTFTEDFGFENILCIYSGRRGIHLWVCDRSARLMQNSARKAILEYLSIFQDKENLVLKQPLKQNGNHPFVERAIRISSQYFTEIICDDQNLLINDPNPQTNIKSNIYAHIKTFNKDFALKLENSWNILLRQGANSKKLWDTLLKLKSEEPENIKNYPNRIHNIDKELILSFLFPRLDVAVSITMNHLLKGPFCIHPKSKRLCVPFTHKEFKTFNPLVVPTLQDLINELMAIEHQQLEKTEDLYPNLGPSIKILKPYLDIFENFLQNQSQINQQTSTTINQITSQRQNIDQF